MKQKSLLLIAVLLFGLNSCKKDSQAPNTGVSIVGKWFTTKQNSVLSYNGVQIKSFTKTNFTTDDFVEYYGDGSGYFSANSATGPSITEFNYVIKGTSLTQYTNSINTGTPETIIGLTATNLSVHAQYLITDPNNSDQVDTEIDDFTYTK